MNVFKRILGLFLGFTLLCAFVASCTDEEAEREKKRVEDSLRNAAGQLHGQLNEKEQALQEFIASFNEIQDNLNAIKEKEKIVTTATSEGDVRSRQNQIREDIQAIYDLMEKNKNRISSLTQKLKQSNLKLAGMQKMIENLQNALNQKDEEIIALEERIEGLNIELSNLHTNYRAMEKENASKTEALNTAWYTIGTSKELKEKNIIAREGGFIGIGKSTKINDDFSREYFTKVDIRQASSINIGARKVKIVTNHPRKSYKLIGEKPVERLEIVDPAEFWSSSRHLVIVIE